MIRETFSTLKLSFSIAAEYSLSDSTSFPNGACKLSIPVFVFVFFAMANLNYSECHQNGLHIDGIAIANEVLLFFLMFGLGVTVEFDEFKHHYVNPKALIWALVAHFVLMPGVGYGFASSSGMPIPYGVGLIAISCAPGGALSNIVAMIFRADMSLNVAITTTSSLVAIGIMPLNLYIYLSVTGYSNQVCLQFGGLVLSALVVAVSIISGILITPYISLKWLERWAMFGGFAGLGIIVLGLVENLISKVPIWNTPGQVAGYIILTILIGIVFGLYGSRYIMGFKKPSCVAIGLETSIQNKFVGVATVAVLFTGEVRTQAVAVPILYAVIATMFSFIWVGIAWKLGWTELDPHANLRQSFSDIRKAIKEKKEKATKRKGEVQDVNTLTAMVAAAEEEKNGEIKGVEEKA